MDFAITPGGGNEPSWDVVCLQETCGGEIPVSVANFGHRRHAEAFLADLIAMVEREAD